MSPDAMPRWHRTSMARERREAVEHAVLTRDPASELAACQAAAADRRAFGRCAEIIPELIVELL